MDADAPASWEVSLSDEERRINALRDHMAELYRPEDLCGNCRLPKHPLRAGRCYACDKHYRRHGAERPEDLVDKEILRDWA